MIIVPSNSSRRPNESRNRTRRHLSEEEVGVYFSDCASCHSHIKSLLDAVHTEVDGDILFFCSEGCSQRYMNSHLKGQIGLGSEMAETISSNRGPMP